jgi:hypothetical protein
LFLESAKPMPRTSGLEVCQIMIFTIFMLHTSPTIWAFLTRFPSKRSKPWDSSGLSEKLFFGDG